MDSEQTLKDFLKGYSTKEILSYLNDDSILNYVIDFLSTDHILNELPFEEIMDYVLFNKLHYFIACELEDDAVLERAEEIKQKGKTLEDYYKRKHFEEIFDKYSLEEIEQALPLKY